MRPISALLPIFLRFILRGYFFRNVILSSLAGDASTPLFPTIMFLRGPVRLGPSLWPPEAQVWAPGLLQGTFLKWAVYVENSGVHVSVAFYFPTDSIMIIHLTSTYFYFQYSIR